MKKLYILLALLLLWSPTSLEAVSSYPAPDSPAVEVSGSAPSPQEELKKVGKKTRQIWITSIISFGLLLLASYAEIPILFIMAAGSLVTLGIFAIINIIRALKLRQKFKLLSKQKYKKEMNACIRNAVLSLLGSGPLILILMGLVWLITY